ncbi:MAG: HEPN domain-containing protein [Deltaproteobacteria bacterium]|nr:HEPN domain-containing protein [Deltaproteobacteria bacterium]
MKPQAAAFLEKSRELLERADKMLGVGLNEDAGRTAYLAAFHAAQALIFEHRDKAMKSHKGVRLEFLALTQNDARIDPELRAFLGRAYNLKAIADYETVFVIRPCLTCNLVRRPLARSLPANPFVARRSHDGAAATR